MEDKLWACNDTPRPRLRDKLSFAVMPQVAWVRGAGTRGDECTGDIDQLESVGQGVGGDERLAGQCAGLR